MRIFDAYACLLWDKHHSTVEANSQLDPTVMWREQWIGNDVVASITNTREIVALA